MRSVEEQTNLATQHVVDHQALCRLRQAEADRRRFDPPPTVRQHPSFALSLSLLFVVYTLSGCDGVETTGPLTAGPLFAQTEPADIGYCGQKGSPAPLTALAAGTYCKDDPALEIERGLYNLVNGTNAMPSGHQTTGEAQRDLIEPLGPNGVPNENGKIVLLSIGMSNVAQEWCHNINSGAPGELCNDWTFMGQATNETLHPNLHIVNGAKSGEPMENWDCRPSGCAAEPHGDNYARVEDILLDFQATPAQVQAVWIKGNLAASACRDSMGEDALDPDGDRCLAPLGPPPYPAVIDAIGAEIALGRVLRQLKSHYPNLQLAFISSRIYAGWNNRMTSLSGSPEPYAFETGFAIKRLIDAQIQQLTPPYPEDVEAGDLGLDVAPWVAWGPYLWDDEFFWAEDFFAPIDGAHPSPPPAVGGGCNPTSACGEGRVANALLSFFTTSDFTTTWFCPSTGC